MALQFATLASGSSANTAWVASDDFGLLVDCGLGPRQIAGRLKQIGQSWSRVRSVLLTHTHGDHWNERTLAHLKRSGISLYCHAAHQTDLSRGSREFVGLAHAGLVRCYSHGEPLELSAGLRAWPVPLSHDCGATFGFRIEGAIDLLGQAPAIGYAADLGCWNEPLVEALSCVDLLALEFNHDVTLERLSGRSPHLIARVLGDAGHLSNAQAAEFLAAVLRRSPGRLRHVIQLHLSRECNRPELAHTAALGALQNLVEVHTAEQDRPGPLLSVGPAIRQRRNAAARSRKKAVAHANTCPWLPGMAE